MNIILYILVGILAGFLAGKIMKGGGFGLIACIFGGTRFRVHGCGKRDFVNGWA